MKSECRTTGIGRLLAVSLTALLMAGCSSLGQTPMTDGASSDSERSWGDGGRIDYGLDSGRWERLPALDELDPDAPDAPKDLWTYVTARFALPVPENPRIDRELAMYAANPDYLELVSRRAIPYLRLIVEQLEDNDLPMELVLLPIVESAYRPEALSRSQAAGIWQFIPATGTYMGLDQTPWYDGRRDIVASTDAATRYFNRLRDMFDDDWAVIIAAYNGGEGTLSRAIEANRRAGKPTDFWSLTQISNETSKYPARFFALVKIFSEPERYQVALPEAPLYPAVARIDIDRPLHLGRLAQLTGVEEEDLYRLNPGYNRQITGPSPRGLLVPHHKAYRFTDEVFDQAHESPQGWMHYQVRRGDSLAAIAAVFGSSVSELRRVNRLEDAALRAGDDLLVPRRGSGSSVPRGTARTYQVQAGDSLWAIARKHGTDVDRLLALNGMSRGDTLRVGQELVVGIEAAAATVASRDRTGSTYVVRRGDTLWGLSRRFAISIEELRRLNALDADGALKPGQVLRVGPGGREA
ncbi:MAG: LysM peptidoglycan-binding domain-containing protein [Halothiobacillaceae bacterium]